MNLKRVISGSGKFIRLAAIAGLWLAAFSISAADLRWQHLSSATGDLPVP